MSYKVFSEPRMSWRDAGNFCEEQGGHLADVTSDNNPELVVLLNEEGVLKAWAHSWNGAPPDCLVLYRAGNITSGDCENKLAFILELDD